MSTTFGLVEENSTIATPGFTFSVTYQLSHHLTSSLQWKTGADSYMRGGLHYDNQKLALSSAIQVIILDKNRKKTTLKVS